MTDWASLGTPPPGFQQETIASDVPVAANQDGRLEVFSIGADNALWHNYQVVPNAGWSGWSSLGQPPQGISIYPAVGRNQDGRLEVFAVGGGATLNGELWHNYQVVPNAGWSGWSSLGALPENTIALTVAANADGRLEVFASATDYGTVWHISQVVPNGGWGNWNSLGLPPDTPPPDSYFISPVAVGRNQDGRLEVFVTKIYYGGNQWAVWRISQTTPGGSWSQWESLDFLPATGPAPVSPPVVKSNEDGRLEVFLAVGDGSLWHNYQVVPNAYWSGWSSLGNTTGQTGEALFAYPTVGRNQDGRLEAFINGLDNALWHNYQVVPNAGWSGWSSLGIPPNLTSVGYLLSVGANADGRLEVFIIGSDNACWHIYQVVPNGGWG